MQLIWLSVVVLFRRIHVSTVLLQHYYQKLSTTMRLNKNFALKKRFNNINDSVFIVFFLFYLTVLFSLWLLTNFIITSNHFIADEDVEYMTMVAIVMLMMMLAVLLFDTCWFLFDFHFHCKLTWKQILMINYIRLCWKFRM